MELPLLELRLAGMPVMLFSLKLVLIVGDFVGFLTVGPMELPLLELRLAGTIVRRPARGFLVCLFKSDVNDLIALVYVLISGLLPLPAGRTVLTDVALFSELLELLRLLRELDRSTFLPLLLLGRSQCVGFKETRFSLQEYTIIKMSSTLNLEEIHGDQKAGSIPHILSGCMKGWQRDS